MSFQPYHHQPTTTEERMAYPLLPGAAAVKALQDVVGEHVPEAPLFRLPGKVEVVFEVVLCI